MTLLNLSLGEWALIYAAGCALAIVLFAGAQIVTDGLTK